MDAEAENIDEKEVCYYGLDMLYTRSTQVTKIIIIFQLHV